MKIVEHSDIPKALDGVAKRKKPHVYFLAASAYASEEAKMAWKVYIVAKGNELGLLAAADGMLWFTVRSGHHVSDLKRNIAAAGLNADDTVEELLDKFVWVNL